jgi:hypothetical protein
MVEFSRPDGLFDAAVKNLARIYAQQCQRSLEAS